MQEVKEVMQHTEVFLRQYTREQHGGRLPVFFCRKLPCLEKDFVQLRGKDRVRQLPEELFDQTSYVARESSGQALLAGVYFSLNKRNKPCCVKKVHRVKVRQ